MTGNLQAIGFLFTGGLGWGIGGSLTDAGLISAGVWLYRYWTRLVTPER